MITISKKRAVVVAGTLAAILVWWSSDNSEQAMAQQPAQPPARQSMQPGMPAPDGVVTVIASSVGNVVTLGGTVVPYKEVTLSAQIPGEVEFIAGEEGDEFNSGDVLIRIDDEDLLAKRRAAIAQIGNIQSQLANAQMQYSRELWSPQTRSISRSGGMGIPSMFDQMFTQPMQSMMPGNIGGDRYVDRSADLYGRGTQVSQAQSQLAAAQAQVQQIDAKLKDTLSVAPFKGVIVAKLVEVGDTMQPGMPMLQFADTTYLQIKAEVPARLVSGLRKGMMVPSRIDIGNTEVDARVAQIFPAADPERHTVTVKFDLPQGIPGGPGMYAEVMVPDINAPTRTLPVIPDTAVVWRGSLPAVFVVTDDNQNKLRLIRLGDYVGHNHVAVLSGLAVGERIRVNPSAGMASGWAPGGGERP
jgi:multidrug efflux pump subunit AcrA (membrane-fusion protein)